MKKIKYEKVITEFGIKGGKIESSDTDFTFTVPDIVGNFTSFKVVKKDLEDLRDAIIQQLLEYSVGYNKTEENL